MDSVPVDLTSGTRSFGPGDGHKENTKPGKTVLKEFAGL
jgi:hypothetical protein